MHYAYAELIKGTWELFVFVNEVKCVMKRYHRNTTYRTMCQWAKRMAFDLTISA